MRKGFGIAMLVLMFIPFMATMIWVKSEQYAARKHVKRSIIYNTPLEELITFEFELKDTTQLNWQHNKEFEWNGEMYDIVRRDYQGNKVIYHVWHDIKETNLNKRMARLYRLAFFNSENNSNQDVCFQLIFKGWIFEKFMLEDFNYTFCFKEKVTPKFLDSTCNGYSSELEYPPTMIV